MKTALYLAFVTNYLLSDCSNGASAKPERLDFVLKHNTSTHIVGGRTATNTYPYYAIPDGNFLCGATLVHADILITAGHCNGRLSNFISSSGAGSRGGGVFIGATKADGSDAKEAIDVELIRIHPDFDMDTLQNDIVLLKLSTPSASPIAKWNDNPNLLATGDSVTVIGFGYTQDGGSLSNDLQEVDVQMVDLNQCQKAYTSLDKRSMICAAGIGKDSCQGDSGGPLLQNGVVVGIVSFGYGCAVAGYPGVYANVAAARDFIRNGICEMSDSPPSDCEATSAQTSGKNSCDMCGEGNAPSGTLLRRTNILGNCNEMCVSFAVFAWKLLGWECGTCPE